MFVCFTLFAVINFDFNITSSAVIQVLPCSLGKLSSSMQCDSSMPPLLLYWMQSSSKVQDARIKCRMYFHFLFYQLMMKIRHANKHILKKVNKILGLSLSRLPPVAFSPAWCLLRMKTINNCKFNLSFPLWLHWRVLQALLAYSDPTDRKNHFQITLSASSCKYQKNKKKF